MVEHPNQIAKHVCHGFANHPHFVRVMLRAPVDKFGLGLATTSNLYDAAVSSSQLCHRVLAILMRNDQRTLAKLAVAMRRVLRISWVRGTDG